MYVIYHRFPYNFIITRDKVWIKSLLANPPIFNKLAKMLWYVVSFKMYNFTNKTIILARHRKAGRKQLFLPEK